MIRVKRNPDRSTPAGSPSSPSPTERPAPPLVAVLPTSDLRAFSPAVTPGQRPRDCSQAAGRGRPETTLKKKKMEEIHHGPVSLKPCCEMVASSGDPGEKKKSKRLDDISIRCRPWPDIKKGQRQLEKTRKQTDCKRLQRNSDIQHDKHKREEQKKLNPIPLCRQHNTSQHPFFGFSFLVLFS